MTPKISLTIGIVAAALVLAAPATAMYPTLDGGDIGNNRGSAAIVFDNYKNSNGHPDFWNYDASGQKIANASPGVAPQDLASQFPGTGTLETPIVSSDVVDRAVAARQAALTDSGRTLVFDNYRVGTQPTGTPTVSATDSGRGDWSGMGIGLGLVLVGIVGFLLILRHMRIRPLAH
jgi:hypothetical protein